MDGLSSICSKMGAVLIYWLVLTVVLVTGQMTPPPDAPLKDMPSAPSEEDLPLRIPATLERSTTEKDSRERDFEKTLKNMNEEKNSEEEGAKTELTAEENGNGGANSEENVTVLTSLHNGNGEKTPEEDVAHPTASRIGIDGTNPGGNVVESTASRNSNGETDPKENVDEPTPSQNGKEGTNLERKVAEPTLLYNGNDGTDSQGFTAKPTASQNGNRETHSEENMFLNKDNTNAQMPADSPSLPSSDTLDKKMPADVGTIIEYNKDTSDDQNGKSEKSKFDTTDTSERDNAVITSTTSSQSQTLYTENAGATTHSRNDVEHFNVSKRRNELSNEFSRKSSELEDSITETTMPKETVVAGRPTINAHARTTENEGLNSVSTESTTVHTKENKQTYDKGKNIVVNKTDIKNDGERNKAEEWNLSKEENDSNKTSSHSYVPKVSGVRRNTVGQNNSNSSKQMPTGNKQNFDKEKNLIVNKTDVKIDRGNQSSNQPEKKLNDVRGRSTTTLNSLHVKRTTASSIQTRSTGKAAASRRPKAGSTVTVAANVTAPPPTFKQKVTTLFGKALKPLAYAFCIFVGVCVVASIFVPYFYL